MHLKTISLIVFLMLVLCVTVLAQRQIVVLSGSEVVHRFKVGDMLRTKWNGDRMEHKGFVIAIEEFNVITSQDTIDLRKVRKVLLPFQSFGQKAGSKLAQAGVLLFVADQVNNSWIQGNDFRIDAGVSKVSAALVVVGITMMLKKNWAKVRARLRVLSVGQDSRFYQLDF